MPIGFTKPPVIILGPHRSGTTLVVKLLKELGFFAGKDIEENQESRFFLMRNEWLIRRSGGSWDNPLPARKIISVEHLFETATSLMQDSLSSWRFASYSGIFSRRLRDTSWGWKDPRNTFTFPIWSMIFPRAKLLYINRNGVDCANSLFVRETKLEKSRKRNIFTIRPTLSRLVNIFREYELYSLRSLRCKMFLECFRIWEEYTSEAENTYSSFDGNKIKLRYENLLAKPIEFTKELAEFADVQSSKGAIDTAISMINPTRSLAFLREDQLKGFYKEYKNTDMMKRLGYDSIDVL